MRKCGWGKEKFGAIPVVSFRFHHSPGLEDVIVQHTAHFTFVRGNEIMPHRGTAAVIDNDGEIPTGRPSVPPEPLRCS